MTPTIRQILEDQRSILGRLLAGQITAKNVREAIGCNTAALEALDEAHENPAPPTENT